MAFVKIIPRVMGGRRDKYEITMEEMKKMLKKFDRDNDGRISAEELREAIQAHGGWFCKWKADRAFKSVDSNSNGLIDVDELSKLASFAQKEFGVKIVSF